MKSVRLTINFNLLLFLMFICGICFVFLNNFPTHAEETSDVFDYPNFAKYGGYADKLSSGIGETSFPDYTLNNKNNLIIPPNQNDSTSGIGHDRNGRYIYFSYGSEGASGGDNRYVNFQMELTGPLRSHEEFINGDESRVTYDNQTQSLEKAKQMLDSNNHQKIYSFMFSPNNYHSGRISVKLYLKREIGSENDFRPSSPLLYVYYKSGDKNYDDDYVKYNNPNASVSNKITNPEFFVFRIARVMRYVNLIDSAKNYTNLNYDMTKRKVDNALLKNDNDKKLGNNINEKLQSIYNPYNKNCFLKNSRISDLIDSQDNIVYQLKHFNMLEINQAPNLTFISVPANYGYTNLASNNAPVSIANFKHPNFRLQLKLSDLASKKAVLPNLNYVFKNNYYSPDQFLNYYIANHQNDGNIKFNQNIGLNFNKSISQSGLYKGTATWQLVDGPN